MTWYKTDNSEGTISLLSPPDAALSFFPSCKEPAHYLHYTTVNTHQRPPEVSDKSFTDNLVRKGAVKLQNFPVKFHFNPQKIRGSETFGAIGVS